MSKVLNIDGINGTSTDGIELSVNSTRRLFINSSGNVGIGTNSPSNRFVVSNSGGNGIEINPVNGEISVYNRSTLAYSNVLLSSDTFIVRTGGTSERLRIDSSGNIGIGTTSFTEKLTISGGVHILSTNKLSFTSTANQTTIHAPLTNTIAFTTNSTEQVRIDSSGNIGIKGAADAGVNLHVKTDAGDSLTVLRVENTETDGFSSIQLKNDARTYAIQLQGSDNDKLYFYDSTASALRMVIDSSGRVGIGTNTPAYSLEVATGTSGQQSLANLRTANSTATNNAGLQVFATPSATAASRNVEVVWDADGANAGGSDYFVIRKNGSSGSVDINQVSNSHLALYTNDTERLRITSAGRLGIGTTNPQQTLDVNGNGAISGWTYMNNNYGHSVVGLYASDRVQGVWAMGDSYKFPAGGDSLTGIYGIGWSHPNSNAALGITNRLTNHGAMIIINGVVMTALSDSIYCAGNITAYSDERVKINWRNLTDNFVEKLSKVKSGVFDRIDFEDGNANKTQIGVSAQSLREVMPEAVLEEQDLNKSLSVSYGNAALAACVELAKEIINIKEQHKKEISELKSLIQSKV